MVTMQSPSLRVLLISEHPEARRFLREAVEKEAGTIIVGEAENATKALILAKNLRPDIAVIDSYLPYAVGLDSLSLSRTGGLDVAQTICEQLPHVRAILVNNLNANIVPKDTWWLASEVSFYRERNGASIPFTLQELCLEVLLPNIPVFANIKLEPQVIPEQKGLNMGDKFMLIGGLAIVSGWFFIITILLTPAGVFLALIGATLMFLGLMGKLMVRLRTRLE
jgi:CheY-like chemotaxis protein